MRFVSTRDIRNHPGLIRELAAKEDIVLTANGKPIALLLGLQDEDLEETALVVRQARAQRALSRMRREAARRGLTANSEEVAEAAVRAARSRRKTR